MTDDFMRVKNPKPGTHPSQEFADKQANPSVAYPGVYEPTATPEGGGTNHQIKPAWWDYTREVNAYMGTLAGWRKALRVNAGWINAAANKPEYAGGSFVPEQPEIYPKVEGVITIHNAVRVIEKKNQSARIEIFDYLKAPPDVNAVNPVTHPWLFDEFHSVNKAGQVGLAPNGERFYFPRLAKNGVAWLPLAILEDVVELPNYQRNTEATVKFPKGKGLWIWQILQVQQLTGNAHLEMVSLGAVATSMGLDHVVVKIATDLTRYNLRRADPRYSFTAIYDDLVPALVDELHGRGIEVYGYAGVVKGSMDRPEQNARFHVQRAKQFGMDGLVANAEGSFWEQRADRYTAAERYASAAKAEAGDYSVGLSSYRFPKTSQPQFPWAQFLRHVDYVKPQVYWVGAHNPVEQLMKSMAQFRSLTSKPIIPDGAAYTESGSAYTNPDGSKWLPTESDLYAFNQGVQALGLSGYTLWEWAIAGRYDLLPIVSALNFGSAPPPPDPELPPDALEQLWSAAHLAGWGDAGWIE